MANLILRICSKIGLHFRGRPIRHKPGIAAIFALLSANKMNDGNNEGNKVRKRI